MPKCGWVRFRWTRTYPKPGQAGSRTGRAAGTSTFPAPQPALDRRQAGRSVGIDRGVRTALVTSDGQHYRAPRISDRQAARYLALQQRMAASTRARGKREKTRRAMARITARSPTDGGLGREDLHPPSLARDVIVLENLNTRDGPQAQGQARPDQPGGFLPNRARAKAGLNRGILASCWGMLARRRAEGRRVRVRGPATSTLASPRSSAACAATPPPGTVIAKRFRCSHVATRDHADTNAAKNVLARGLATAVVSAHAPGHGTYARVSPRKRQREPPGARREQPAGKLWCLHWGGCQRQAHPRKLRRILS